MARCGESEQAGKHEPADADTEKAPGYCDSHQSPRPASLCPVPWRARGQFSSVGAVEHIPLCPGEFRFGQRSDPSHLVEPLDLIQLRASRPAFRVGLRSFEIADHLGLDIREGPRKAVPPKMLDR